MTYLLHIGERNYSSWSLRGWMLLAGFGLDAEIRLHPLDHPDFELFRKACAPARTAPALEWREGGARRLVWDSLAIAETLAERHPEAGHWPAEPARRMAARAIAAEMHSGFHALRGEAPMNIRRDGPALAPTDAMRADLGRLAALVGWARGFGDGGPYLFGARPCAADAFLTPVAFRVATYRLPVADGLAHCLDALRAHPAATAWAGAARAETRVVPADEI